MLDYRIRFAVPPSPSPLLEPLFPGNCSPQIVTKLCPTVTTLLDPEMRQPTPLTSGSSLAALAQALALLLLTLPAAVIAQASVETVTKNYIDTISGYASLSSCAEGVLSTVVRGQFSGCGDSNALTSYTCFCTDSSSYMSAVISSDVVSSCPAAVATVQASSALGVFEAYCELGVAAGLTTITATG